MGERKATIHDFARLCESTQTCDDCPLGGVDECYGYVIADNTNEYNDIILKWCDEHPLKTYLQDFTEKMPNCRLHNGVPAVCVNCAYGLSRKCTTTTCHDCWNTPMPTKGE